MRRIGVGVVVLALLLLVGIGMLVVRALSSIDRERAVRHEMLAERLFDELERELTTIVEREEERSFMEYRFFYVPDEALPGEEGLARSPLSRAPEDSWLVGYFQIEPDGGLNSPRRPRNTKLAQQKLDWSEGGDLVAEEQSLLHLTEHLRAETRDRWRNRSGGAGDGDGDGNDKPRSKDDGGLVVDEALDPELVELDELALKRDGNAGGSPGARTFVLGTDPRLDAGWLTSSTEASKEQVVSRDPAPEPEPRVLLEAQQPDAGIEGEPAGAEPHGFDAGSTTATSAVLSVAEPVDQNAGLQRRGEDGTALDSPLALDQPEEAQAREQAEAARQAEEERQAQQIQQAERLKQQAPVPREVESVDRVALAGPRGTNQRKKSLSKSNDYYGSLNKGASKRAAREEKSAPVPSGNAVYFQEIVLEDEEDTDFDDEGEPREYDRDGAMSPYDLPDDTILVAGGEVVVTGEAEHGVAPAAGDVGAVPWRGPLQTDAALKDGREAARGGRRDPIAQSRTQVGNVLTGVASTRGTEARPGSAGATVEPDTASITGGRAAGGGDSGEIWDDEDQAKSVWAGSTGPVEIWAASGEAADASEEEGQASPPPPPARQSNGPASVDGQLAEARITADHGGRRGVQAQGDLEPSAGARDEIRAAEKREEARPKARERSLGAAEVAALRQAEAHARQQQEMAATDRSNRSTESSARVAATRQSSATLPRSTRTSTATSSPSSSSSPAAKQAQVAPAEPVDVRISPLRGERVGDDHMLLHRTVRIGDDRYLQGFAVRLAALEEHLRSLTLAGSELDDLVQLAWDRALGKDGSAPEEPGFDYVFNHDFEAPFAGLAATAMLRPLPHDDGDPRRWVFAIALLMVGLSLVGLGSLFRMVSVVVQFAERRNNFVAAVSHELKTPLTAIRMYGEILRDGLVADDSRRQEYYGTITAESERLSRLIDNVLELSRLEKGSRPLSTSVGSVGPVLEEVMRVLSPHATGRGFELELEVEEDLPTVAYDRDALLQVVINLVDNALKFAGNAEDKTVVLQCTREGDGVALRVRDHGPGVPVVQVTRIFQPFFRGERELTRRTKGTGIGLALVKGLVEQMGGHVVARNHPTGGFEVSILLSAHA